MLFDVWWRGGGSIPLHFTTQDITHSRTTDPHILPWGSRAWTPLLALCYTRCIWCLWRDSTVPTMGACDTIAWVGWTHEEPDAHHVLLSLRLPLIPLPQTSTLAPWSFPCKALPTLHWCNPSCSGSIWHMTCGGHSLPESIMLKRSPALKIYCASSTIELLQRSLATWDSPAGRCCLYREMEQFGLPVIGVVLFAPSIHYLWWLITFCGGAYGVRTQHHTLRSLCLWQVTLQWNTPPGMVMLSMTGVTSTPSGMVMLLIPRVTLTPLSDGKDILEKCYSTLR